MPHDSRVARAAVAAGALSLVAALFASIASAQPKVRKDFEAAYNAGQDAFALGKYNRARAAFEKARKIQPELAGPYRWLTAIAHTQKRWTDCLREAEGYLARSPRGSQAPKTRELHAECRTQLGRRAFNGVFAGAGAMGIATKFEGREIEGVIVRIDGMRTGATRMAPRAVTTGKHEIKLEHRDYLTATVQVDILEGIVIDVEVDMTAAPKSASAATPVAAPSDVALGWVRFAIDADAATILVDGKPVTPDATGQIESAPGTFEVEIKARGYENWRRRVRFLRGQRRTVVVQLVGEDERAGNRRNGYIALSAAGVFMASGVVFGLLEADAREQAEDIYDTETQRPRGPMGEPLFTDEVPLHTRADLEDATDRARQHRLIAGVSFGLAAAALGVSVYYFVKERPLERDGFELPLAVAPLGDGAGGVAGVGAVYSTEVDW